MYFRYLDGEKQGWGEMSLYFGCRQSTVDHIYESELSACAKEGVLSQVNVALSREPGKKKVRFFYYNTTFKAKQ